MRDAVTQAGGDLATVVAVREPLDLAGSRAPPKARATRRSRRHADRTAPNAKLEQPTRAEAPSKLLEGFGTIVAKQLVSGGQNVERELISRVRGRLLTAFDGQLGKLAGLVVVRNDPTAHDARTARPPARSRRASSPAWRPSARRSSASS